MTDIPSMRDPERVALKEWAVLVDAMAHGDLIAMIRKGGIRENRAGFSVRHDRFVLYPTFFHEKLKELDARFHPMLDAAHAARPPEGMIRLRYVAIVAAVWQVTELECLRAICAEHGLTWGAVESRFRYRDDPRVHVVALRIAALPAVVEIPEARRYTGCVSWVNLHAGGETCAPGPGSGAHPHRAGSARGGGAGPKATRRTTSSAPGLVRPSAGAPRRPRRRPARPPTRQNGLLATPARFPVSPKPKVR